MDFVGPDLGPNCLQSLSADDRSPLAGKGLKSFRKYLFIFSEKSKVRHSYFKFNTSGLESLNQSNINSQSKQVVFNLRKKSNINIPGIFFFQTFTNKIAFYSLKKRRVMCQKINQSEKEKDVCDFFFFLRIINK